MAKNVVTGKNEITAKNIIMADNVVVNETEAKDEKKKDWSKSILAAVLIPLLGIGAALFAVFYEKPKTFLPNPLLDQAEVLLLEGDYTGAIDKAEGAKAVEADNPRIYLVIYAAQELSGNREEAKQALRDGEQNIKKRATGGKEIRAVLAAAETSPEEGLAAVAESYRSFDFKELARKFLLVLVKKFEETGRFWRMLGEMDAEAMLENKLPTEIPDNVFTFEDAEQFGATWDSDPYEAAAKFGISRSLIDQALKESKNLGEGDGDFIEVPDNHPVRLQFRGKGFKGVAFDQGYSGPALPYNIYVGMNVKQVFESFYHADEMSIDSAKMTPDRYIVIYDFFDSKVNFNYSGQLSFNEESGYYITYSIHEMSSDNSIVLQIGCDHQKVKYIFCWFV